MKSPVKRTASERDVLSVAEEVRNLLEKAVADDKAHLDMVFGGECQHIRRIRHALNVVEFSDMHKNDCRCSDMNKACTIIEEVLKTLGIFKPWEATLEYDRKMESRAGKKSAFDQVAFPFLSTHMTLTIGTEPSLSRNDEQHLRRVHDKAASEDEVGDFYTAPDLTTVFEDEDYTSPDLTKIFEDEDERFPASPTSTTTHSTDVAATPPSSPTAQDSCEDSQEICIDILPNAAFLPPGTLFETQQPQVEQPQVCKPCNSEVRPRDAVVEPRDDMGMSCDKRVKELEMQVVKTCNIRSKITKRGPFREWRKPSKSDWMPGTAQMRRACFYADLLSVEDLLKASPFNSTRRVSACPVHRDPNHLCPSGSIEFDRRWKMELREGM